MTADFLFWSTSRIVIYGVDMLNAIVPNSAKPFNFQIAYGLSEEDVSMQVTDKFHPGRWFDYNNISRWNEHVSSLHCDNLS